MPKQVKITLNEIESDKLDQLIAKRGYRPQEMFRGHIHDVYRREFPPYTKKQESEGPLDKLSPVQYCRDVLGGEVDGDVCVLQRGAVEVRVQLDKVKEYNEAN